MVAQREESLGGPLLKRGCGKEGRALGLSFSLGALAKIEPLKAALSLLPPSFLTRTKSRTMSEALTMIPYTSLCRVLITPMPAVEVDERFRHIYRPYYPRIQWENDFCVVTCASHDIALMFMETFRRNPGQEMQWYLEGDEEIDPATLPPGLARAEEEGADSEDTIALAEEGDDEEYAYDDEEYEDHPDLCQVCMRDYVDPWGNCQHCVMSLDMYGRRRRPNYMWF